MEAPSATVIAQPFVAAVTETFSSLLGLDAIGSAIEGSPEDANEREGITAFIEFSGPRYGVVLVTFPETVAHATVARMLESTGEMEDEDVSDGVGELVNIVSGRAKSVLSALGLGRLDMSVPTVLRGFSLDDLGLADADWSRIDFATELGPFTLRVAFARHPAEAPRPLKVMIADDSRVMRKIERSALAPLGADTEFFEAPNGAAAIQLLESRGYDVDLVVLDLKMPERDGYDVVTHMRKSERGLKLPVVVVSSLSKVEASARLAEVSPKGAGPLMFVGKPFDPQELLAAAQHLASKRGASHDEDEPTEEDSTHEEATETSASEASAAQAPAEPASDKAAVAGAVSVTAASDPAPVTTAAASPSADAPPAVQGGAPEGDKVGPGTASPGTASAT